MLTLLEAPAQLCTVELQASADSTHSLPANRKVRFITYCDKKDNQLKRQHKRAKRNEAKAENSKTVAEANTITHSLPANRTVRFTTYCDKKNDQLKRQHERAKKNVAKMEDSKNVDVANVILLVEVNTVLLEVSAKKSKQSKIQATEKELKVVFFYLSNHAPLFHSNISIYLFIFPDIAN